MKVGFPPFPLSFSVLYHGCVIPTFFFFQEGHYVQEKEFPGIGITPFDPYHNSSFVVAGESGNERKEEAVPFPEAP